MTNLNVVTVLGLKIGVGKTGNPSNTISYSREWSDYDRDNGAVGVCAESRWTNIDLSGVIVGDVIELIWQPGYNGAAVLAGYRMVQQKELKK